MTLTAFAQTIGMIYDMAMAPGRWPELLTRLGQDFHCHVAGMVSSNTDRSSYRGIAVGVDRAEHQNFLRRHHQSSPLRLAAPPKRSGQIIDCHAIMPRAALERTEMYQDFFRPNDLGEGVGMTIWQGNAGVQTIALVRSWAAGPFDAAEHALAQALMPHLQCAAQVARHLQAADLLVRSAHAMLDAMQQPVLLLDRAGRPVYANAAAEAMLGAQDGLAATRAGLAGATTAATRKLEGLIAAAAAMPGSGGTMRLPRPSGKPALVAIAMPIRRLEDFMLEEHPAVLLCVSDPALHHDIEPRMLMELFGLTRAEAALGGQEVKAIAEATRRSVNTVRNLLARLMAKTETGRQSELVRVLDRLPRVPRGG